MMKSTLLKAYPDLMLKILCISMICFMSACGLNEADTNTRSQGALSFTIEPDYGSSRQSISSERSAAAISDACFLYNIQTITAEVYDENDVLLVTGGPWQCGGGTGTIVNNILIGKNRTLLILCRNAKEEVVFSGIHTDIEIKPGKTARLGKIRVQSSSLSLTADGSDPQSIKFSWNKIDAAVNYRVIISDSETLSPAIVDEVTTNNQSRSSDLETYKSYYWQVIALYGNGTSDTKSDIQEIVISPPSGPDDVDDDHDGFTENMGDCNDQDPKIYPDADEIECDGIDQDCSGGDLCTIVYVDPMGDLSNDGRSWEQAVPTLMQALEIAEPDDSIWVRQGVYTDPIAVTIPVQIYGGFSGDESIPEQRNPEANPTMIDCGNMDSRCIHVASDTVIDGFEIQNGAAADVDGGGGILIKGNKCVTISATIQDCTFRNNFADNDAKGGAVCVTQGKVHVLNCRFEDNLALSGGAISSYNSDLVIEGCSFSNNLSNEKYGGAVYAGSSVVVVRNTFFNRNQGALNGGGIAFLHSSSLIVNSVFWGNTAQRKGGAAFLSGGDTIIANCSFSGNTSGCNGGAVAGIDLSPSYITNSILYNDTAPEIFIRNSSISVTYSDVEMSCGIHTGEGNINLNPGYVSPGSGDLHLLPDSPCIDAGDTPIDPLSYTDIEGNARVINTWVDMGAYENP